MSPSPPSWVLEGRIVLPDGRAVHRFVHVENGRIAAIGPDRPAGTDGLTTVRAAATDLVYPGLLDLHSHTDYNVLPIWETPLAPFDNRFGWRGDPTYRRQIGAAKRHLADAGGDDDLAARRKRTLEVFAELQAVAGGTTVLQESFPLDEQLGAGGGLLLCRDTADPDDLGLPPGRTVMSVVDFFAPDPATGEPVAKTTYEDPAVTWLDLYARRRDAGELGGVLVHLAEGRSGFGRGVGVDTYSRREFEAFMKHPALEEPAQVTPVPITLIHGSGIDPRNEEHVRFLTEREISVLWSPVSNLLLYQDTLDVESFLAAGINLALGSDWSPSGSKHVWDELKFARWYLDAIGARVSDAELFAMATLNAARCLRTEALGQLRVGAMADFFVLRSGMESATAMEVLLTGADADVRATVIGGTPVYGEADIFESLDLVVQPLPEVEGTAAATKVVHLPDHVDVDLADDLQEIENHLKLAGILRSNTLASSDVQYGARIARLKAYAAEFGWSAQRARHEQRKAEATDPGATYG